MQPNSSFCVLVFVFGLSFGFESHVDKEDIQLFDWSDLEADVSRVLALNCDVTNDVASSCLNRTDEQG